MVEDTSNGVELRGEEAIKATNKIENLIKYTINFDLVLLEQSSGVANSKYFSEFRLRIDLFSKRLYLQK